MKAGRAFGVELKVHPALLVFLALWVFMGQGGALLCAMGAIILHESCHVLCARAFGIRVASMELTPFGGVARLEGYLEISPIREFLVALAGPLSNALVVMGLLSVASVWPLSDHARLFLQANMTLMLFNLLPALPLDGGRMLRAVLGSFVGLKKATALGTAIGQALAVFGLLWTAYGAWQGHFNVTIPMVSVYLFYIASMEKKQAPLYLVRSAMQKRDAGYRRVQTLHPLVAPWNLPVESIVRAFSPDKYHRVTILDANGHMKGELDEQIIVSAYLEGEGHKAVGRLL